jgi:hypothetical protein
MLGFPSLPPEIRSMIYEYAFEGQAVRIQPNLKIGQRNVRLASSAALLTESKTIYTEARHRFYRAVRTDVSSIIDQKSGTVASLDPALLRRVKISQEALRLVGGKVFIKSLKNLQTLTYDCHCGYFIYDECIGEDLSDFGCDCEDCWDEPSPGYLDAERIKLIEKVVNGGSFIIIGKCCDPQNNNPYWYERDCESDQPIRSLISAWAWNDMPFQLIAKVRSEGCMGKLDLVSSFVSAHEVH